MDPRFAKPIVQATQNVLSTMAMITPEAGNPYIKQKNKALGDVSGVIGITADDSKQGVMSVTFTKNCAVAIVKNLLGDDIEDVVKDVKDAVGEITNMIAGQARQNLEEIGINLSAATPTVVMGDNHSISHVTEDNIIVVPFDTDNGPFVVEFSMNE